MDARKKLNPNWLKKCAHGVIEHMNQDHQNTIVSTLNAQLKIKDPEVKIVKLRSNGYFVLSNGSRFFLKLEKECKTPEEYKNELVKNAKKYRAYELHQSQKK